MCSGCAGASAWRPSAGREQRAAPAFGGALALLSQVEIVAGNRIRLEAKIGGITPAMLSFSGRCEFWFM